MCVGERLRVGHTLNLPQALVKCDAVFMYFACCCLFHIIYYSTIAKGYTSMVDKTSDIVDKNLKLSFSTTSVGTFSRFFWFWHGSTTLSIP